MNQTLEDLRTTIIDEAPQLEDHLDRIYRRMGDQGETRNIFDRALCGIQRGVPMDEIERYYQKYWMDDPNVNPDVVKDRKAAALHRAGFSRDLFVMEWSLIDERDDVHGFETACAVTKRFDVEHVRKGRGLCFLGSPGTGKSLLATLAARQVSDDMVVMFASAPTYIERSKPGGNSKWVDQCFSADLLIIDDLGEERLTEFVAGEWELLISHRYNEGLSTIWTSNLTKDKLAKKYGGRIFDRIRDRCEVIELDGKSYRGRG